MSSIAKIRRLLNLVERLQSGRMHNSRDLAALCQVSRRTMFRDLKTLQESGVPILYDQERQGYWLPPATYLPPTDFTLDETLALLLLAHDLGRGDGGVPFQQPAQNAALKLLSNLPGHLRSYVGELTQYISLRVEKHHPLTGAKPHFDKLTNALSDRKRVRIAYHSLFENRDINTLLSPYRLLFTRRAWYVIGRSSLHRAVRTFHVGRILDLELTEDRYDIPPRFSLTRYLGNAWHLIRDRGQRREVVVRFQRLVATNVAEVAWHKTQKAVWNDDGTMDFHVTVDGIQEISWWILGYGDQAQVLQPPELRDIVAARTAAAAAFYGRKGRRKPL